LEAEVAGEANDPAKAFLGVGWAFPPQVEADGAISEAIYEEDVRQAIRIILFTNRGERESLITWEARIDVQDVSVTADPEELNKLEIAVSYRVRLTNTQHNLVYPFYLQEGTPS
jgi:uncharacterized protein